MSKTVLVVEDDKSVQSLLTDVLVSEGYSVICERDGERGLKAFEAREVDFIILDILIPVMNGFQVAHRIRRMIKGKHVPILMISGIYHGINHRQDAIRKYKVVDYLDKPLRIQKLLQVLKRTLGDDRDNLRQPGYGSQAMMPEAEKNPKKLVAVVRRGRLEETCFTDLLAELCREGVNGSLLLRRDRRKKIVYLRDGCPIFVKSNLLHECLGKVMVQERMITESDLKKSVAEMKQSGRRQGRVLIDMGCISMHNLQYGLQQQLKLKLFDLFGWEHGEYRFSPKSSMPPTAVSLGSSAAAIIYEGVRHQYKLDRLCRLLDHQLERYVVPCADSTLGLLGMDLEEEEQSFVARIKGNQTLRELLKLDPRLDKERTYQIVQALKCMGMITLEYRPESKSPLVKQRRFKPVNQEVQTSQASRKAAWRSGKKDAGQGPDFRLPFEEYALMAQLTQQARAMKNRDFFELLGVSKNASRSEIKQAYFALVKQVHPDRIGVGASAKIRHLADEIFRSLTNAHDTLLDETRRQQYLGELSAGNKRKVSTEVSNMLSAEGLFQQGQIALHSRKYHKAKELLEQAVALCPQEGEFRAYLGWALFQSDPNDKDGVRAARDQLNRAISLNPKVDKAYLFLGNIYKAMNYQEMAKHEFEKAVQCNPDCTEALRELRLIKIRRKPKKRNNGFVRRSR